MIEVIYVLTKPIGPVKQKYQREIAITFLKQMFWSRNKKTNFQLCTLIWGGGGGHVK